MTTIATDEEKDDFFYDILTERRYTSDLVWASRLLNATSAYKLPFNANANLIKSFVFNSLYLREALKKISEETKVPIDNLYEQAHDILEEIGYDKQLSVLRWLGFFVVKIFKKLNVSVFVNEAKFLKIKSQMGSNPVLFAPSHKSYCDFVLMSFVCFHYDVDIPAIAAGTDFQSMAFMSRILRDACAFFMRRSFKKDKLYYAVFSQYIQTLVTAGSAPIEFFIEGTRSRTSKSLSPKHGFLQMVLKPFFLGLVPDISIVPVTINYDRVLEEVLFAYELLGVPKPKETTLHLIKALNFLKENYGNMYVHFGDPFPVKAFFSDKIDRSVHSSGSVKLQELTKQESEQIAKLAHTIVQKQKELTTLNCFNLIAAILNDNITVRDTPITINQLVIRVQWLSSILKILSNKSTMIFVHDINREYVINHLQLHKSLVWVSDSETVQLCKVHVTNSEINSKTLTGHTLSDRTMSAAIPILMIQYYANPCAHLLVGVSFIALIVQCLSKENSISFDVLNEEFQFLSAVFSYEFAFYSDFISKNFREAYARSQELNLINVINHNQLKTGDNSRLQSFCVNFLSSYLPGYIVVIETLLESTETVLYEKQILKACQAKIESKLNDRSISHPNNLSLDLLKNAFQSFYVLEGLSRQTGNSDIQYLVNPRELKEMHSKLKAFDVYSKQQKDFL